MSSLFLSLEEFIASLFGNVDKSFSGTLKTNEEYMNELKNDLYSKPTPTVHDDRANLRNDASNVAKDYRKAYELKLQEY